MITPGTAPDGAYVPGASFGPDNRGVDVNVAVEAAKAQMSAPYMASFGDIGQIFIDTLNGLLQTVVNGIVAGAQAVGMVVTGIFDTIAGAIQWVTDGIASLFGVGSPPAMTVGSKLADAYDKQQELIGKVDELMEDNAGFINACMSKTINIDWTPNRWMFANFDTYTTDYKNARIASIDIMNSPGMDTEMIYNLRNGASSTTKIAGGNSIVFDAPGVWVIDGQVAYRPNVLDYRYFEVDVRVFRLSQGGIYGEYWADELYTESRFASGTDDMYVHTVTVHKPIIVPDDGYKYGAVILVRNQVGKVWEMWGGAKWTSLSAVRQSIDTTNYNAEDEAVSTVTVTE